MVMLVDSKFRKCGVLQEKKNEAATKIQSLERGRQCRQQLAAEQEEQQQQKEFAESASNQQIEGADQQDEQQARRCCSKDSEGTPW